MSIYEKWVALTRKNHFLLDTSIMTPPAAITAIPIRGDQLRWWGLFAVILRLPISTTFSLVKNVIAVKMVRANPRITIKIPVFFIRFWLEIIVKDRWSCVENSYIIPSKSCIIYTLTYSGNHSDSTSWLRFNRSLWSFLEHATNRLEGIGSSLFSEQQWSFRTGYNLHNTQNNMSLRASARDPRKL